MASKNKKGPTILRKSLIFNLLELLINKYERFLEDVSLT